MAVLCSAAVFFCFAGCAMHEYAERKYSNPQFYPYPYLYYSPYPVPYTYDPLADWRKPEEQKVQERFEGESK
ncbi:MAG: hypothetical protein OHK006_09170 [Thermodesulfovibrionales bacterium]